MKPAINDETKVLMDMGALYCNRAIDRMTAESIVARLMIAASHAIPLPFKMHLAEMEA